MQRICPKCGFRGEDSVQCSACGLYYAKFKKFRPILPPQLSAQSASEADLCEIVETEDGENISVIRFNHPLVNLLSLPIALVLGVLFHSLGVLSFLFGLIIHPVFHEFGHTLIAWVGGRVAIPIFLPAFGYTSILSYEPSLAVYLFILMLLLFAGWKCFMARVYPPLFYLFFLIAFQFHGYFRWDMSHWEMWMIAGGIGGAGD